MPGPKVRADYDALKAVAQSFGQQAQAVAQSLQMLTAHMDTLQGGDWVGQGATAFYAEMNDQVLPAVQRLRSALESGADVTQKTSQVMQAAEEEAANVLRGSRANPVEDGAAAALGRAAAPAPGSADGPAAGIAGATISMPQVTMDDTRGGATVTSGAVGGPAADLRSGSSSGAASGPVTPPPAPGDQGKAPAQVPRITHALDTLDTTMGASETSQAALLGALQNIKDGLDSQSELGEMESQRLQMAMDRMSKMMSTLSNILKQISDTNASIIQNIK